MSDQRKKDIEARVRSLLTEARPIETVPSIRVRGNGNIVSMGSISSAPLRRSEVSVKEGVKS